MELTELDFELPGELIAQHPLPARGLSRLLCLDRKSGLISHHHFQDLIDLLPPRVHFFRNNATVFKARLAAVRETGGGVECLLLRPLSPSRDEGEIWECLLRPGRKFREGSSFADPGHFRATVVGRGSDGKFSIAFFPEQEGECVLDLADRIGTVPLPPYIRRPDKRDLREADSRNYQTVYADPSQRVAAAAPTAGLHFSTEFIQDLKNRGHRFHDLTLHVGLGTFQPIQVERVEDHTMHRETYEIPFQTQLAIRHAPESGSLRLAIGTTTVRSVEDFLRKCPEPEAGGTRAFRDEAGLFLTPPATFLGTDALLTNFHLPRSTLLCLVGAFLTPGQTGGLEWLREIYTIAIKEKYRFFSYGDAMLIL